MIREQGAPHRVKKQNARKTKATAQKHPVRKFQILVPEENAEQ
jgi:hypothetical protein